MTTLREAAQQALEALDRVQPQIRGAIPQQDVENAITALRAALAEPEQRPISDVTEAVTKTVIEVEKLLCGKIGRQWQPSDMSIRTLVDELAALVAAAEREACAKACEARKIIEPDYEDQRHYNQGIEHCADAIRARGEQEKPR